MLSALGRLRVTVRRRPRVAVLPTGDEVVPPSASPGPGQIRDANSYTLAALVLRCGGVPTLLDVAQDEEVSVQSRLREAVALQADLILTSGGVSVGDYDLVKHVLASEGEMHFWSLNMKPGRPMAFGVVHGIPLLGLPGNPVAVMVSAELFARPALLKMQGFSDRERATVMARLRSPIERKDGRRHYLRVRLIRTEAGLEAELTGDQGSGILSSLVAADGLAVISENHARLPAGSLVPVLPLA
jgi:molybdopterin molybdotransferase